MILKHVFALILLLCFPLAQGLTVRDALAQGNEKLLHELPRIPLELAPNIVKSYNLVRVYAGVLDQELVVTQHSKGGATIPGHMLLDYGLELMAELPRQFVIAHEFAHVRLGHPAQRIDLMARLIPDDVASERGLAKLRVIEFTPEMRNQSFAFEYAADEDGARMLMGIGWSKKQILAALNTFEQTRDSATHPSIQKRYLNLKSKLPD